MGKRGFSIIELVLVILVVGISSVGLASAMQQVLFNMHKPEIISMAVLLAEKEAERVIEVNFNNLTNEFRDAPQSYGGSFPSYSRQVRVDTIDANNKVVEVRVHHVAIGYTWIAFLMTDHS